MLPLTVRRLPFSSNPNSRFVAKEPIIEAIFTSSWSHAAFRLALKTTCRGYTYHVLLASEAANDDVSKIQPEESKGQKARPAGIISASTLGS
jgi:hypothetical protein